MTLKPARGVRTLKIFPPHPRYRARKDPPPPPPPRWTHWAALAPPVAVLFAWLVSHFTYERVFCGPRTGGSGCESPLAPLTAKLTALDFTTADQTLLAARDVAARFAWQSSFVLFLVVAGLAAAVSAYLVHRSVRESRFGWVAELVPGPLWMYVVLLVGVPAFTVMYFRPDSFVIRTGVLEPLVGAALGGGSEAMKLVGDTERIFRSVTLVASVFVALAAGAALLAPAREGDVPSAPRLTPREHLSNQWRRLNFALYAGAALLVAAIVHQTAFYGWAGALLDVLVPAVAEGAPAPPSAVLAREVATVVDAAIVRAGGLVYSLLLLVTYLPAALILLERARELSREEGSTEKERGDWRAENGIGFSLSTQWVKALAVLSPSLASIPAAQFLLALVQ